MASVLSKSVEEVDLIPVFTFAYYFRRPYKVRAKHPLWQRLPEERGFQVRREKQRQILRDISLFKYRRHYRT